MKKGWLLHAALFIAVAVLGSIVYLKPRSDVPENYPLSVLRSPGIKHVRIERNGEPGMVIERTGERWSITAPVSAPADPFQVERLLAILEATSAHRLPATDLARFDLDPPRVRLTIDGERFGFGAVNAVTREQYVLAGGAVHAIAPRYGAMVPANLAHLLGKQLLSSNEFPVRLEFRDFTVAMSEGKWGVSPPPGELSQDDMNRWIDAWRHATALRVEPYAGGEALDVVRMELKDGRTLALDILQKDAEFALGRPDQKLRYYFAGEPARRLLAPPGSIPPEQR
jgi:hypothetical protein